MVNWCIKMNDFILVVKYQGKEKELLITKENFCNENILRMDIMLALAQINKEIYDEETLKLIKLKNNIQKMNL